MAAVAEITSEAAVASNNTTTAANKNDNNNNLDSETKPTSESEFTVQKLVDMFTKLNPLAKEFFPSSYSKNNPNELHFNNFAVPVKQSANDNFPKRVLFFFFCLIVSILILHFCFLYFFNWFYLVLIGVWSILLLLLLLLSVLFGFCLCFWQMGFLDSARFWSSLFFVLFEVIYLSIKFWIWWLIHLFSAIKIMLLISKIS